MDKSLHNTRLIDLNYFSDILTISRSILKQLAFGQKTYLELLNNPIEVDDRIMYNIPYKKNFDYALEDLVSRGLVKNSEDNSYELTSVGLDVFQNYTLDNLSATSLSNRLTERSNKISIRMAILSVGIAILSAIIATISLIK